MENTRIEYIIDNFSGIKKITDFKLVYLHNKDIHYRYSSLKKPLFIKNKMCGVYILYDKNKQIIYVGKSKNVRNRLVNHLFLDSINMYISDEQRSKMLSKRKDSVYFSYIEVECKYMHLLEVGLITKHQPKYNSQYVEN